jgi:hypothetical protein
MRIMKSCSPLVHSSRTPSAPRIFETPWPDSCIALPKIPCAFHPGEPITNFCTCDCCLLPLCPSCVKIHTNEHITLKQVNPQYEPITDLLEEVYSEVQELLAGTSEGHRKISEVDAKVGTFRATVQQKVESVKQSIVGEV